MADEGKVQEAATWKDTQGGYNVDDEKTFPDGSQRILGYSPTSGVRRWLGTSEKDQQTKNPDGNSGTSQQPNSVEFQYPKEIVKPEWQSFNTYLTEDNPFLFASTYDEVVAIWFRCAYDLNNKIDILKEELVMLSELNPSDRAERKKSLDEGLKQIEEKYKTLDNQFLALVMYKVNVAIIDIERFDMNFTYEGWINKGRTWNDIFEYLEQVQQPDYFNNNNDDGTNNS